MRLAVRGVPKGALRTHSAQQAYLWGSLVTSEVYCVGACASVRTLFHCFASYLAEKLGFLFRHIQKTEGSLQIGGHDQSIERMVARPSVCSSWPPSGISGLAGCMLGAGWNGGDCYAVGATAN